MIGRRFLFTAIALAVLAAGGDGLAAGGGASSSRSGSGGASDISKAVSLIKAGGYNGAIAILKKAVKSNPRNADAWNYLGYSYRKVSRFEDAHEAYTRALAIDPRHRGAHEYLGELYLQTHHLDKAEAQLDRLRKLCGGCEEYGELRDAIESYKAGGGSG